MDPVPPPPNAAPTPGASAMPASPPVRYAGFWLRWVACLIDSIVLAVPIAGFCVVTSILLGVSGDEQNPMVVVLACILILFSFPASWLYFALMESSPAQGTLGKRALGLKVTDDAGRRIGFGRATGRYWAKVLSGIIFNIGYIMAAFTERKRALHDMIAKTLVVRAG